MARLLVERGAHVYKLWHAAALGKMSQVEEFFAAASLPARPGRHGRILAGVSRRPSPSGGVPSRPRCRPQRNTLLGGDNPAGRGRPRGDRPPSSDQLAARPGRPIISRTFGSTGRCPLIPFRLLLQKPVDARDERLAGRKSCVTLRLPDAGFAAISRGPIRMAEMMASRQETHHTAGTIFY